MKKKVLALVLCIALVTSLAIGLVACNDNQSTGDSRISFSPIAKENIKFGLICLHDDTSTYDKNFIDACKEACSAMGIAEPLIKTGISEDDSCYEAAADLADQGCNVIFADSFGHEEYILKAAKEFPSVRFSHATGTSAHLELQANFYNAFASIYEARYLAGIVAGMKLNEMIAAGDFTATNAKMGYVGAFPYAEVISGYTSFYLGAKSVCSSVKMDVRYTNSWYDATLEGQAAQALIDDGCKLISQHADSMGAPNACEIAKVPNVSYNISTASLCPDTFLVASKINWAPYFEYLIGCIIDGVTAVDFDWCGSIATGSVQLTDIHNIKNTDDLNAALDAARAGFADGSIRVFDTSKFTVGGAPLTTYLADVDDLGDFVGDTQVVKTVNGVTYFAESEYRSAPYFNIIIDGITVINAQ